MDAFAEAAAAGLGGVVSASALYPLEIIKNSMQSKVKGSSKGGGMQGRGQQVLTDVDETKVFEEEAQVTMSSTAEAIYKSDGAAGFFRGIHLSATGSCVEKFIYFYGEPALSPHRGRSPTRFLRRFVPRTLLSALPPTRTPCSRATHFPHTHTHTYTHIP